MPLNIDFMQILLHMFNFLILAGGLVFLVFKPVEKFLTERREYFENAEKKIKEDAEQNEALRKEYELKIRNAHSEISNLRSSAEKEIAEISKNAISQSKEKAEAIILAAEKEAEARKVSILDSAQTEISELVLSASQKLLSDTVTPERDSALYDEFIRVADKAIADKRVSK